MNEIYVVKHCEDKDLEPLLVGIFTSKEIADEISRDYEKERRDADVWRDYDGSDGDYMLIETYEVDKRYL